MSTEQEIQEHREALAKARDPEALADAFEKAADHLDKVGWHQYDFVDRFQLTDVTVRPEQCRVCAEGALSLVLLGHPDPNTIAAHRKAAWNAARNLSRGFLGMGLDTYNDGDGRTAEEITTALRVIAAKLGTGDLPAPSPEPLPSGTIIRIGF